MRAQEPNLDHPVVRAKSVHTDEPLPPHTQLAKCWDFSSLPKGLTHANGCLHGHEKLLPTKNKLTDIAAWHYQQLLPVFPEQSHCLMTGNHQKAQRLVAKSWLNLEAFPAAQQLPSSSVLSPRATPLCVVLVGSWEQTAACCQANCSGGAGNPCPSQGLQVLREDFVSQYNVQVSFVT